jgi:hypothetical protein
MDPTLAQKALRLRKHRESQGKPSKYSHTYRITPEDTDETLFSCDVIGHVSVREVVFVHGNHEPRFSMQPNRRIMPTYWPVTDAMGREIGQVKQHLFKGGHWSGLDSSGEEVFRIVSAESVGDRVGKAILGGVTAKYCMVNSGTLLARMAEEPRSKPTRGGVRGFLQAFFSTSDWVVRFEDDVSDRDLRLILPAMVLLIDVTVALDRAG